MNKIGIMQGRLSPRPYPSLQKFPQETWEDEFGTAKEIGYDFIEWIFEADNYEENPIWTTAGRRRIKQISEQVGIPIKSVCADYFLERPFQKIEQYSLQDSLKKMSELISKTAEIGAERILLPVLENAELKTKEEAKVFIDAIEKCIPILEANKIVLGFETELTADYYKKLCDYFRTPHIGAYYDTGNCAYRGYDMRKDMEILKDCLVGIHIKDRKIGGESVFLGTGDTNFKEGIPFLIKSGYKGDFLLQTYFEDDYINTAKSNIEYIQNLINTREESC